MSLKLQRAPKGASCYLRCIGTARQACQHSFQGQACPTLYAPPRAMTAGSVRANGLPLWGGLQMRLRLLLFLGGTKPGQGAALRVARRAKERTYPKLLAPQSRCRLLVIALEVLPGPVRDSSRKHSDADTRKSFNLMGGGQCHARPPSSNPQAECGGTHRSQRSKSPLPPDTGSCIAGCLRRQHLSHTATEIDWEITCMLPRVARLLFERSSPGRRESGSQASLSVAIIYGARSSHIYADLVRHEDGQAIGRTSERELIVTVAAGAGGPRGRPAPMTWAHCWRPPLRQVPPFHSGSLKVDGSPFNLSMVDSRAKILRSLLMYVYGDPQNIHVFQHLL